MRISSAPSRADAPAWLCHSLKSPRQPRHLALAHIRALGMCGAVNPPGRCWRRAVAPRAGVILDPLAAAHRGRRRRFSRLHNRRPGDCRRLSLLLARRPFAVLVVDDGHGGSCKRAVRREQSGLSAGVRQPQEHIAMTRQRRTPAIQIAPLQLGQLRHPHRVAAEPRLVCRNALGTLLRATARSPIWSLSACIST